MNATDGGIPIGPTGCEVYCSSYGYCGATDNYMTAGAGGTDCRCAFSRSELLTGIFANVSTTCNAVPVPFRAAHPRRACVRPHRSCVRRRLMDRQGSVGGTGREVTSRSE